MLAKRLAVVTAVLGLGLWSAGLNSGRTQGITGFQPQPQGDSEPAQQEGVEIQTRGTIRRSLERPSAGPVSGKALESTTGWPPMRPGMST